MLNLHNTTQIQRHEVESTLFQQRFNVVCPVGVICWRRANKNLRLCTESEHPNRPTQANTKAKPSYPQDP